MTRKKKKGDPAEERFRDFASLVGEHFSDYLIVGRIQDGLRWKYSDKTFATGVCRRMGKILEAGDVL